MIVHPLLVIMLLFSLIGAIALFIMLKAVKKFKLLKALKSGVLALLCVMVTATSGLLYIANHGYRAFTRETLAAIVSIEPVKNQLFTAQFIFPDSTIREFTCAGDQLYVDAHILKWHPFLNLLGVHTTYELDRVAGRYISIEDEKEKPRNVYSLSNSTIINMFHLRNRLAWLKPFLDAEYGSATFIRSDRYETFRILVSTSGLLVRKGDEK